jgi:hypothetical protein
MNQYIIDIRLVVDGDDAQAAKDNLAQIISEIPYEIVGIGQKVDNTETV